MASEYAQRFVNALLSVALKDPNSVEIVGEVGAESSAQPHASVYLQLGRGAYLATTAGVSERACAREEGLQHFELCALTAGHSPSVLSFLSEIALFIHASEKPVLPYEVMQLGQDEQLLLVPRWKVAVPDGPSAVDVVEPVPLSTADWEKLGALSRGDRATWARTLAPSAPERWTALFPKVAQTA